MTQAWAQGTGSRWTVARRRGGGQSGRHVIPERTRVAASSAPSWRSRPRRLATRRQHRRGVDREPYNGEVPCRGQVLGIECVSECPGECVGNKVAAARVEPWTSGDLETLGAHPRARADDCSRCYRPAHRSRTSKNSPDRLLSANATASSDAANLSADGSGRAAINKRLRRHSSRGVSTLRHASLSPGVDARRIASGGNESALPFRRAPDTVSPGSGRPRPRNPFLAIGPPPAQSCRAAPSRGRGDGHARGPSSPAAVARTPRPASAAPASRRASEPQSGAPAPGPWPPAPVSAASPIRLVGRGVRARGLVSPRG